MLVLDSIVYVLLLTTLFLSSVSSQDQGSGFTRRRVRMCMKPEFTRDVAMDDDVTPEIACAAACSKLGPSCQGFHVMEKPGSSPKCRTFLFDRCSHLVRTDCDQFVWAFVRNQAGLPDGQLCPDGFGSSYFGSAYKIVNAPSWTDGQTACSGLKGLAKCADAFDRDETAHFHWLKSNVNGGNSFFIGGWRPGGSVTDPWYWKNCSVPLLPEVWGSGQPNEGVLANRLSIWSSHPSGVDDCFDVSPPAAKALCECVDPFM